MSKINKNYCALGNFIKNSLSLPLHFCDTAPSPCPTSNNISLLVLTTASTCKFMILTLTVALAVSAIPKV